MAGYDAARPPSFEEQKARADRLESRIKLMTAVVGLLAAIATGLGAFWGVTAKKASEAQSRAEFSSGQVTDLQTQVDSLQKQLADAKAALMAAQSAPASPSPDPTPSPDLTGPDPAFVKGLEVPLTNYTSIQLSRALIQQSVGVADLYYAPKTGRPALSGGFAHLSTNVTERTRDGCRDAVDTRPTTTPVTKFKKGDAICAESSGGVALLVVTAIPDAQGTLGLQLTYWDS